MCTIRRNQLFSDLRRWIRIPGELINEINNTLEIISDDGNQPFCSFFDSSLSKVIVQSLMAALARSAGGFNSSNPHLLTAMTNLHAGCLKVPWPSKLQKSCTVLTLRARSSIIYLRCNDSIIFFTVSLHQNVFIYLENWVLENVRFYFSALFCAVFFCHDHEMIDQLNYYCCNDTITTEWCILWFFFFPSDFKHSFVITNHLWWSDVLNHTGSWGVSGAVRGGDMRNVVTF